MVHMDSLIIVALAVVGACLGSFAGATVWRLRARQLVEDRRAGEVVDKKEYTRLIPLTTSSLSSDRSQCLHCNRTLAWYDLIPLLSWFSTKGRCRYCKATIGKFEPLMELGVAGAFVTSYLLWPVPLDGGLEVALFGLWLVAVVLLAVLFAYDLKWFLLPDSVTFSLIAVSAGIGVIKVIGAADMGMAVASLVGAILVLSGLYYLLWVVSRGQWIGFGDVKLGIALGLFLADWRLALLALFGANLIGTLVVLPGMFLGRLGRKAQVPFGPFLIAGAVIAMLIGESLIDFYQEMVFF